MFNRSVRLFISCVLIAAAQIGFQFSQVIPAHAAQKSIHISTQRFEYGSMIWRSDTGEIWVLADAGLRAYKFPASAYSGLSDQIGSNPPDNRIKPISGFGAVWANFDYVRIGLGWATLPEIGYAAQIDTSANTIRFARLDHQVTVINHLSDVYTWHLEPKAGGPARYTTYAAYQDFDNGFMLWRADTQEVIVFFGKTVGQRIHYPVSQYGTWSDNPMKDRPPAGHVAPINAFGRVWSNMWIENVKQLGWPIAAEQGYTAAIVSPALHSEGPIDILYAFSITLPTGHTVYASSFRSYWRLG